MSMKTAFVYALTLSLGIAAVSHAKTLLIELAPQETAENQELVQHTVSLVLVSLQTLVVVDLLT